VPTAVEYYDFARGGKTRKVALHVELCFFAVGRGRQSDHAKDTGTDAFHDRFDRAALPSSIPTLKYHDDPVARVLHPRLQLAELDLKLPQLLFVFFAAHSLRAQGVLAHTRCSG